MPKLGKDQRKALHGEAYAERFENSQPIKRIARLARFMSFTGAENIVDVGCGNALSMTALKGTYRSYVGVDFSEAFIRAARARSVAQEIQNAEFYCGSAEGFAAENPNRFDAALALDISEHVYDDEWHGILIAIRRMLVPGGRIFLHTPNLDFFIERMKDRNFLLKQFPEHIAVRTLASNVDLLKDAGLQIVQARYLPHYNWLSMLHPMSALPVIGDYFAARIFIEAVKPPDL